MKTIPEYVEYVEIAKIVTIANLMKKITQKNGMKKEKQRGTI